MERVLESGNSARTAWRAVGLLLALAQPDAGARAQDTGVAVAAGLAAQKAQMLESLFRSDRLEAARTLNRALVEPLVKDARARLEAARAALESGDEEKAIALLDEGIRLVAQAVTLSAKTRAPGARSASDSVASRRRQAESFLVVLEADNTLPEEARAKVTSLRERFEAAGTQFSGGDVEAAGATLDRVYRDVVGLLSRHRGGHTVFVARTFETPEDEYRYERERNESYVLLVETVLADRGSDDPGISALAARLTTESEGIRRLAESQATNGEFVEAIASMERSTERLFAILRSAGVFAMGMP